MSLNPQLVADIINGHLKTLALSFDIGSFNVAISNNDVKITLNTTPKT